MMKIIAKRFIRGLGFDLVRYKDESSRLPLPRDFYQEANDTIRLVEPYTMTSSESLFALIQAVEYIERANIPGSIVECGVWRGGSMMAVAYTLNRLGKGDRDLYLFDTYEGMPQPTDVDINFRGDSALARFERAKKTNNTSDWAYASIEEVQSNLARTGYDPRRMKFIKGKVEDTIPESAPTSVSILRLDTDWYASTRHELLHLYPRLSVGGIIIVDDYGHWQGSKKATDEYFVQNNTTLFLNRIDCTVRLAVKR